MLCNYAVYNPQVYFSGMALHEILFYSSVDMIGSHPTEFVEDHVRAWEQSAGNIPANTEALRYSTTSCNYTMPAHAC